MAKRGPKRRTAKQRRAQSHAATTTGTVALPTPDYLEGFARAEFERIVRELDDMGALETVDLTLLVMAAEEWGDIRAYRAAIKKNGRSKKTKQGYVIANPDVKALKLAVGKYSALLVKLGLTAVERQRLGRHAAGPEKPEKRQDDGLPTVRIAKAG